MLSKIDGLEVAREVREDKGYTHYYGDSQGLWIR